MIWISSASRPNTANRRLMDVLDVNPDVSEGIREQPL